MSHPTQKTEAAPAARTNLFQRLDRATERVAPLAATFLALVALSAIDADRLAAQTWQKIQRSNPAAEKVTPLEFQARCPDLLQASQHRASSERPPARAIIDLNDNLITFLDDKDRTTAAPSFADNFRGRVTVLGTEEDLRKAVELDDTEAAGKRFCVAFSHNRPSGDLDLVRRVVDLNQDQEHEIEQSRLSRTAARGLGKPSAARSELNRIARESKEHVKSELRYIEDRTQDDVIDRPVDDVSNSVRDRIDKATGKAWNHIKGRLRI